MEKLRAPSDWHGLDARSTPPTNQPRAKQFGVCDRRAQARHVVDASASIFFIDVRAQIAGRILDVSLGGCRIRTHERFPVGIYRRVETEFTLDGLPVRLAGVVQAVHDRFTVGIRFLDMSSRKRDQLADLIADIEETNQAEKSQQSTSPGASPD